MRVAAYRDVFRRNLQHESPVHGFTPRLKKIFGYAREYSLQSEDARAITGTEHVLLAILTLEECLAVWILKSLGVDVDQLIRNTEAFLQPIAEEDSHGASSYRPEAEDQPEELDAELEKYHIPSASKRLYQQDNNSVNPVDKTTPSTQHRINTKEIPNNFVQKYFSSPVEKSQNPILLYTSPLASNKGFCLVEYNRKYSLIGYINDDIFLLNQFDNVKTKEIRARLSETQKSKERYIIKLDNYQALVEVSDKKMNLLVNL